MSRRKIAALFCLLPVLCVLPIGCGSSPPVVATIMVTSAQASIAVSGTDSFTAIAEDRNGTAIPGVSFTWASSAANVATINAGTGVAMGMLPGTAQITASANGITSGPRTLTVTPGFRATSNLTAARYAATATLLNNGMVLVAGGYGASGALASAELFNPSSGTFTATGSMSTARYFAAATLLNNGMVLVAGGYDGSGSLAGAELYNPATGIFTPAGYLNTPRRTFTSTLLNNGTVLVAGGYGASGALASAELYDPVTETFRPTGSMNDPRRNATATLLNNGTVLVAGGLHPGGTLASAEVYDPNTGAFTFTGSLTAARYFHSATLLNSGMVLIAGGGLSSGSTTTALTSAELYNPATGSFTATGTLNAPRLGSAAALMNNGTVLLAGGQGTGASSNAAIVDAELYDPTAGTFSVTGSMNVARVVMPATLLDDGRVLLAGGGDGNTTALGTAELYEPGSLTPPGLESIAVSPAGPTASPGTYQRCIATGTFAGGPQQLASVLWSSSDSTLAEISSDATNPGASVAVGSPASTKSITITAAAGTVSGMATLNVRPTGFVFTGNLIEQREFAAAITLNDGRVLVTGGDTQLAPPSHSELYDPASGTFSTTGIPVVANRAFFTATLLMNG